MTDLELKEHLLGIEKTTAELHKLNRETIKISHAVVNLQKRNRWFEFTLMLAVVAATVAVTKLFL